MPNKDDLKNLDIHNLLKQALSILRANYGSLAYNDPARTFEYDLMDEIDIILHKKRFFND